MITEDGPLPHRDRCAARRCRRRGGAAERPQRLHRPVPVGPRHGRCAITGSSPTVRALYGGADPGRQRSPVIPEDLAGLGVPERSRPASRCVGSDAGRIARKRRCSTYAGLHRDRGGRPVTSGGRVLHVVGKGRGFEEARGRAYRTRSHAITFPGMRYRSDIAGKLAQPRTVAGIDASGQHTRKKPRSNVSRSASSAELVARSFAVFAILRSGAS